MALTPELLPYLAALAAALAGSLHCAGMCGPLRLLCSDIPGARWKYQLGRGLAYACLGALAGGIGFALPLWALLPLVVLGLLASFLNLPALPGWTTFRRQIQKFGSSSPFLLGLSSGLLPCGLLHGWLAAAAASGHPWRGALLLGMLWAGSLPALELGPLVLRKPLAALNRKFPVALKILLVGLALLPLAMRLKVQDAPHCHVHNEISEHPKPKLEQ